MWRGKEESQSCNALAPISPTYPLSVKLIL